MPTSVGSTATCTIGAPSIDIRANGGHRGSELRVPHFSTAEPMPPMPHTVPAATDDTLCSSRPIITYNRSASTGIWTTGAGCALSALGCAWSTCRKPPLPGRTVPLKTRANPMNASSGCAPATPETHTIFAM
eukprot:scaffold52654_cov75-Phaeocystis_antarctica.AAC.5